MNSLFLKIDTSPAPPSHYGISHDESKTCNAVSSLNCRLAFVILQDVETVCNKEEVIQEGCGQNTTIKQAKSAAWMCLPRQHSLKRFWFTVCQKGSAHQELLKVDASWYKRGGIHMLWWGMYAPHSVALVEVIVLCNALINLNAISSEKGARGFGAAKFWGAPYFFLFTPEESWSRIPPWLNQLSEISASDPGQEGAGEERPPEHGLLLQLLRAPDLCQEIQSYISHNGC